MIRKICPICGNAFNRYPSQVTDTCSISCGNKKKWRNPEYQKRMSEIHKGQNPWMKGRKHRRESILKMRKAIYRGREKILKKNGYIYVYCPDHPRASCGRVPEQILVAEKNLGRNLKQEETVHHINFIRDDNRACNLLICSVSHHKKLHANMRGFGTKIQSNSARDEITGRFMLREII